MTLEREINRLWDQGGTDPAPIEEAIRLLDAGELRVAEPRDGDWIVHEWVKKAVLLYFRVRAMEPQEVGPFAYLDKIPLKRNYRELGVRVVPPATARYGSFLSRDVILMPSYVNIGAWVGPRTMVDTWATVGSCAQIGADVHLAGGVGIGGVLEPLQARPVIVEDGAFIGSRCIVTEGVRVAPEPCSRRTCRSAPPCRSSTSPARSRSSTAVSCPRGRSCSPGHGPSGTRRARSTSPARSSSESAAPRRTSR